MYCKSCGADIPDGQSFCPGCGMPVQPEEQQPVVPVYKQPVYAQPINTPASPETAKRRNITATNGLILSIVSIVLFWSGLTSYMLIEESEMVNSDNLLVLGVIWIAALGAALTGSVLSIIGLIKSIKEKLSGKVKAIIGIILSLIHFLLCLAFLFLLKIAMLMI